MSDIKKRSLSIQNRVIITPEQYSKSECSPEKFKRQSQRQQQTIILSTPIKMVGKSTSNLFDSYIDGNQTVKEGWLYQNKKIYVQLTRQSIREFNDEQQTLLIRVISLKEFEFNILQEKQIIKIQFPQLNQILIYQAKDAVEAKMWIGCLNIVLDRHRNHPKNKLQLQEVSKYFGIDVISEEYFLKIVESGDVLLFETDNTGAKLQRVFTNTKYDHVAIAIKMANKYLFVFDANADTGVTFIEWSQFIEINDLYEKLAIRKLIGVDRIKIEKKLIEFLQQVHGKKYEVTFSKLFRQKSLSPSKSNESFFCSELVAKAFKYCGLLESHRASCSFLPVEFTKKLQLTNQTQITDDIVVILKKHLTK
ncbi:unnamed protein product (macronuclear) [Paramecium tetraurelia]|uniref:PH domain-containing protein n=1 Tax=Paramecium tetraurelia TaxID=5888 RepID=A0CA14_PARTE|nr:uncharacterized protein GSPATT00036410001 [Paramecium tetraurelia]CAK67631.1 unnamed protein product [Paramecium tetraurelia]|eukprot:XP_001435028.1 hypothetical protein (macronuclear) [Paramecium tetraurelia strain d4-2]